jgi:tetratricopeptide (TPR) repeat protein
VNQQTSIPAPALEMLRNGDLAGARALVESTLASAPGDRQLLELAALLAGKTGDSRGAARHFRVLLAGAPDDRRVRLNLAIALTGTGELEEVVTVCGEGAGDPALLRLLGFAHQELGRLDQAASAYRAALALVPGDFESWNNLGNTLLAAGDVGGAVEALRHAIDLQPDAIPLYKNLSEALARAERYDIRQRVMRAAARRVPNDAAIQCELGLAESGAQDFRAAEAAFRKAIALSPGFTPAYLELGLLLENRNRIDELAALVEEADGKGIDNDEIVFLKAWLLRRQGRIAEALPLAEAIPDTINSLRRHQLLAELYERNGEAARAFAEFEAMNAESVAATPAPPGPSYRDKIAADAERLTAPAVAAWTPAEVESAPPAPVFIVGFPRSGTTLLDTLLMNMPQLHVLEELPMLVRVESELGGLDKVATLTSERANALRRHYFDELEHLSPSPSGATVIDKHPLHMARIPLIHRLFPDAKIILVERHPCDAVLSCFMANFQLNTAMREFVTLESAARLYDTVFDHWTRATALLPVAVHRVRYERMVEDLEGEMRPLLDFLGLPWDPKVLDNRASSAKREHIRTASYSQVTEPIYSRAAGRWERYRSQMAEVLPLLAPWAERMGYSI